MQTGPVPARKRLIHALVHEIRVESREMSVPGIPGAGRPAISSQQGCSDNGSVGAPHLPQSEHPTTSNTAGQRPGHPPARRSRQGPPRRLLSTPSPPLSM
jgi:hypothetical protein